MKSTLLTVTAFTAVAALGGVAGATLTGGSSAPASVTDVPTAPVEVRTQIVHRTERVVHHVRRVRRQRPTTSAAPVQVPISQPAATPRTAAQVATRRPRVITRTSGATSRSEDGDHERESEPERGDD